MGRGKEFYLHIPCVSKATKGGGSRGGWNPFLVFQYLKEGTGAMLGVLILLEGSCWGV